MNNFLTFDVDGIKYAINATLIFQITEIKPNLIHSLLTKEKGFLGVLNLFDKSVLVYNLNIIWLFAN